MRNKKNKIFNPFIIAEIGNNHEGSFKVAKKLIIEAYRSGVSAVKFQTFNTEDYVNKKDFYRYKRLKSFELSNEEFIKLSKIAKSKKLKFISTPFDLKSAEFLNNIVDVFKISSGDNNYYQLLNKVLSFKKPTIISTGLLNYKEIVNLVKFVKKSKFPLKKLTLLHCVSDYPAKDTEANLNSIVFLKKKFKKINIGYSDHTLGITACIAASTLGASIMEKHFTLKKNFSTFRDHKLSADPEDMKNLVNECKRLSKMMGQIKKEISINEKKNIKTMRRSIFARERINKNQKININNIKIVRPLAFLKSNQINKILNKISRNIIEENEPIKLKNIKK